MLRRTPMKRGTTPMKRTGIKAKPGSKLKSTGRRKHKIAGHHEQKLLDACKGEPCYLQVPGVCRLDPKDPTVVACHGNWADTGKGLGLKAADRFSVPGCASCHHWLDVGTSASRAAKRSVFFNALARWEAKRELKINKGAL